MPDRVLGPYTTRTENLDLEEDAIILRKDRKKSRKRKLRKPPRRGKRTRSY